MTMSDFYESGVAYLNIDFNSPPSINSYLIIPFGYTNNFVYGTLGIDLGSPSWLVCGASSYLPPYTYLGRSVGVIVNNKIDEFFPNLDNQISIVYQTITYSMVS